MRTLALCCVSLAVTWVGARADQFGALVSLSAPRQVLHGDSLTVTATINNVDVPYDEYSFFSYYVIETKRPELLLDTASWPAMSTTSVAGVLAPGQQVLSITIPPEQLPSQPGNYSLLAHARIATQTRVYAFGLPAEPQSNAVEVATSPRRITFTMAGNFTPPLLRITSPRRNVVTETNLVLAGVAGRAGESIGVEVQVNGSDYLPVQQEGTNWSAAIVLNPGRNTVNVRATDQVGNQAVRTRTFNCFMSGPLTLSVNGQGRLTPLKNGQLLVLGRQYALQAIPDAGYVFSHWTETASSEPLARFTMSAGLSLEANFVPNPFPSIAGPWHGLFYDTNSPAQANAGQVSVAVTGKGALSGSLLWGTRRYPFSGRLNLDLTGGQAISTVTNSFTLTLDFRTGSNHLAGTVTDGNWLSQLSGFRQGYGARWNPATNYAGNYTLGLLAPDTASLGDGFGRLKISAAGQAVFSLVTGDGKTAVQSVPVFTNGALPCYRPLYGGGGGLVGWLQLADAPESVPEGQLLWTKPAGLSGALYAQGFTNSVTVVGSPYLAPPRGSPAVPATNILLVLEGGNLDQQLSTTLSLDAQNRFTVAPPNGNALSLSLSAATGTLLGSFTHPATGMKVPLKGVLLQKQALGCGFFPGANSTGRLRLQGQ